MDTEKTLKTATIEELRAALAAAEKQARTDKQEMLTKRWSALRDVLTASIIDILAPKHGQTLCSDGDPHNGFGSGDARHPRCLRCELLNLLAREEFPVEAAAANLTFSFMVWQD